MTEPTKRPRRVAKKAAPPASVDVELREVRPGRARASARVNLWPEDAEDLVKKAREDPILGPLMSRAGPSGREWGGRADVTPAEAILNEVQRTEYLIEWIEDVLRGLGDLEDFTAPKPWPGKVPKGQEKEQERRVRAAQVRQAMQLYQSTRGHQARVARSAEAMRLAERKLALNEARAQMIVEIMQGVLGELDLSQEQWARVPGLMRSHVTALVAKTAKPESPFIRKAIEVPVADA